MQLIDYDKQERISTLKINDEDLGYIVSILGGVSATWSHQLPAVLGLDKSRFDKLENDVRAAFLAAGDIRQ